MTEIQELSFSVSAREAAGLLKHVPMPEGITLMDIGLIDNGFEAIVRASSLIGMPIRLRFLIQGYEGHKITLRLSPPLKLGLEETFRPLFREMDVRTFDHYSLVEVDLLSLSKGRVKNVQIKGLTVKRAGVNIKVENLCLVWEDILGG